ncbi:MAG: GAF domain-containing protein [Bacteroidetes bacterium]|nr:GAF domain-containing protein [Bacteroidota bacterium]
MSFITLIPLISFIFVIFLGIFVYKKNTRLKINIIFFWLSMVVAVWLFGTFMMFLSKNNDAAAIFWDRFIYLGVVFIPSVFYHFGLVFNKLKNKFLLLLGYIFSIFFLIISRTDYFVTSLFRYTWGIHTQAGFFHHLYLIFFTIYISLFFLSFYKTYKTSSGLLKQQTKYILLAFIFLILVGATAFLPAYKISIYPFSYIAGVVFTSVVAYAIVRYRLMDIRLVIRSFTIYGFSFFVSVGLSLLSMFLATKYLSFYISSPVVGAIILIGGIIIFQLVKESFSKFANKHLFYTLYSYEKTLGDLTEKLSRTIDLDRLVNLTVETIKDVMKLDKVGLVLHKIKTLKSELKLIENHQIKNGESFSKEESDQANFYLAQNVSFEKIKINTLIQNDLIVNYLEKTKKPLVKDEISHLIEEFDNEKDREIFRKLDESMKELGASLYLPLIIESKLIGLFVLGKKISGDAYTIQDLNLLETVANQIAIAINNAQLYEQSQYFNQILKVRVAEATKELAEAYRELKKLDDSKTEFLSLASHQLRTPLSAIKGYLSIVMEGNFGKLQKKTEGAIKDVYQSNERLINLVNDLLNITRIEAGRLEYCPQQTNLSNLIQEVIKELEMTAKNKNLTLISKIAKIPQINLDPNKIRQVLINLIDNAIKYTEKGGITIQAKKVKDQIMVEIKDTGIGINKEKMETLFQWFSRGKGTLKLDAGGFGLGLYIAKKIIEKANGKIWAESKGNDKGTTFSFSLPIK